MQDAIRFGIVGCGAIGPTHAGALRQIEGVQLIAAADVKAERVRAMAAKFGIARTYCSADELVRDREVGAVIIATPSGMHAEQAIAAMRAGKHVIVEKPMEVSLEACDRMIAVEQETGCKLAIISQHRFDPATVFVRDAVHSGRLGKLLLVEVSVKWWRSQAYYDEGDWRGTWTLDGGGALMNQGVHSVDLMQWIAGPLQSVSAHAMTGAHERIEVEDVIVAALKFRSGAIGTLTASTACYDGEPARIAFYGTNGSAVIEGDRLKFFKLADGTKSVSEIASPHAISVARGGTASVQYDIAARLETPTEPSAELVWGDAHREQIRDFIAAIRTNGRPLIDGAEGRKPIEIIRAIYESSRSAAPVNF